MHVLATNWKKLRLNPTDQLADYAGAVNLLEFNKVPSFNSANVWMMRELAEIVEENGDDADARQLRLEADAQSKAVMTLYEPGKGVWASLHRYGTRVEMRHCYDFAAVGRFLTADLPPNVCREMVDFVQRISLTGFNLGGNFDQAPRVLRELFTLATNGSIKLKSPSIP